MSRKRRTPRGVGAGRLPPSRQAGVQGGAFPHLETFFRGYLHEDMEVEHGSVEAAFEAFLRDVPLADRAAVAAEGDRLAAAIEGLSLDRLRVLLTSTFRSAWHPARKAEVSSLAARMRQARSFGTSD